MTGTTGYAERAHHYAAEVAHVPRPRLLADLLRPGQRVAELPSATGHFLRAYAAADAEVTLIDACPEMLKAALRQAGRLPLRQPRIVCCRIQDLSPQIGPIDLAVVPNAALNQLAADTHPGELLISAAQTLAPGGLLLSQVLFGDEIQTTPNCGFYDPAAVNGTWLIDRRFTGDDGQPLVRRRRQRRDGDRLHIDFELTRDGELVYSHGVDLRLLAIGGIETAAAAAGLTLVEITPGHGGLHEVLIAPAVGNSR